MTEINIVGVFTAFGILSKQAQALVRKNCEAGHVEKMREAVTHHLLLDGICNKRIVLNSGIMDEIVEAARSGCVREADAYHGSGGVLTAKGYWTAEELSEAMLAQWKRDFSKPIEVTKHWPLTEEMENRLTVVALRASQVIAERAVTIDYPGKVLLIPVEGLEGLCSSLARATYEALELPNETIHKLLHGET